MRFGKWINTSTFLVGFSFLLGGCASVSQSSTSVTLDRLMADPALDGATVSLMVRDARTGSTLYQHNPRTRLVPASNLSNNYLSDAAPIRALENRLAVALAHWHD